MTAMGEVLPADLAGGETLRSMLHAVVDRIFDDRSRALQPLREAPDLRRIAQTIYERRRLRSRALPKALLGEPAWDMLLDLFARDPLRQGISTKGVCVAADVPYSTAWRCLGALESGHLIERCADALDARRNLVRLTDQGETAVMACLDDGWTGRAPAADPPAPPLALAAA